MRTLFVILVIFLATGRLFGQIEATTGDGKKVVLYQDGTWKYLDKLPLENRLPDNPEDCSNWIETHEDKVSGNKTIASKETLVISEDGGKTGFGIYWILSGKNPILSIQAAGASNCIDEGSKINILFKDGTRLELANDAKFNCEGNATLYFLGIFGKRLQLEQLAAKKIEVMRVWTSKSYVEKTFDEYQSETMMRTAQCIMASVK